MHYRVDITTNAINKLKFRPNPNYSLNLSNFRYYHDLRRISSVSLFRRRAMKSFSDAISYKLLFRAQFDD